MGMLQNIYRCRMGRTWILNTTTGQKMLWSIISVFLDKETKEKIHLTSEKTMPDMKHFFNPSQLPTKYGGISPDPV